MFIDKASTSLIFTALLLLTTPSLMASPPPPTPTPYITAFDCDAQRLIFYDYNQNRTVSSTPIRKPGGHGHFTTLHDLSLVPGQDAVVFSSSDDAAHQLAPMNIYRLELSSGQSEHITGAPLAPADHPKIRIKGRVLDRHGYAIEGMRITAIRTLNKTLTDSDGWFVIEVPAGYINLLATLEGPGEDTFGSLELLNQEEDLDDAAIAILGRAEDRMGFSLATPSAAGQHIYMSQGGDGAGPQRLLDYDTTADTFTPLPLPAGINVHQLALSPDGQRLLVSERDALSLLELNDMRLHQLLAHDGAPSAAWLSDTLIGMTSLSLHTTALLDLKTLLSSNINAPTLVGQRIHGFSQDGRWMFIRDDERDWMIDITHEGSPATRPIRPLELDCDPDQAGLQRCEHLCAIAPPARTTPQPIEDEPSPHVHPPDTAQRDDLDGNDGGCSTSPIRHTPAPCASMMLFALGLGWQRRRSKAPRA